MMQRNERRLAVALLLAGTLALGRSAPLEADGPPAGDEAAPTATGAKEGKPSGDAGAKERTPYGRPPPGMLPYGRYGKAYREFFLEPTVYHGPGRKKKVEASPAAVDIGVLAPLDPANREEPYGRSMLRGMQIAFDEANAEGGFKGVRFRLLPRNDGGAWGSSSNIMADLAYNDGVWAVMGSVDGASTHVALRVALKAEVPMVTTASTDPTVTETRIPWILRCNADDRRQGYALAQVVFRERGLRRVTVLRANDRYGRFGIREFTDAARRLGHPILVEMRYLPGARTFTTQLDRIQELDPEAIVMWGDASDVAGIVKAVRSRGMNVQLFAGERVVFPEFLELAGRAAEGLTAAYTFDPTSANPDWLRLRKVCREKYGAEPDAFLAHGYDGARILIAAIRRAGLNRARILDELQALRRYEGVTGLIEFDSTLNDVGPVTMATVEDGRWTYRPQPSFDLVNTPEASDP